MSDFEFYTRSVGLDVTPPAPQAASSPLSVVGKALQDFGQAQLAKSAQQQSLIDKQKSIQAGSVAGQKLGFKPLPQTSENNILFNNAAMEAQKGVIQNNVRNQTMQFKTDELINTSPGSLSSYDSKMAALTQSTLANVTPELQPYAKNALKWYGISNRAAVASKVGLLNKNIANSNLQLTINNNLTDATNAAFSGNQTAAMTLRGNVKRMLDASLGTGAISAAYSANTLQGFDKHIKFSRYEGQFNTAIQNDTAPKALASFINGKQKDLMPDEKQQLLTRFNGMLTEHKQALVAQYGNIEQKVKDLSTNIYLNGMNSATQGEVTKLNSVIDQFYTLQPGKAQALKDSMDFAQRRHDWGESVKFAPPAVIQEQLQQQQTKLKADPSFEKLQQFGVLTRDAEQVIQNRKANLYQIAASSPAVKVATSLQNTANTGNVSLTTGNKLGPATVSSHQDRDQAMIDIEKQMGTPNNKLTVVSPTDLSNLQSVAAEGNSEQTIKAIQLTMAQHINHRAVAMMDIQKAVPAANFMVLNGALNPATRGRAAFMFQAADNKVNVLQNELPSDAINGMKDNIRTQIMSGDYGQALLNRNGDPTKVLNSAIDYTYKLALVYKQNNIADPEDQAIKDSLTSQSQVGTYNGRQFVIPLNDTYNPSTITHATNALLGSIKASDLRVPSGFFPGIPLSQRQKLYRNHLLTNSYPVTTTDNKGIILLDDFRIPVKNINNQPFGFEFQDLNDPSSSIHKQLTKKSSAARILDTTRLLLNSSIPTTSQFK